MSKRLRVPLEMIVYLTLVVPEIVIAVASLIFFVQLRHYISFFPALGPATILIGQVVYGASLTMLIVRARFVGMGDKLEEAAYDLGSGRLSTFRQVTFPRLLPAIIAAGLLSFTISFDDFVLPAFTNGTTNTWPIVLYSSVRFGITPAANALATIMLRSRSAPCSSPDGCYDAAAFRRRRPPSAPPRLRSLRRRPVQVG